MLSLRDALARYNMKRRTFYDRLASGMNDEQALTEPLQK
jgi:hypothetical protein